MPSPGLFSSVLHGWVASRVAECRSEILICLRMNDRSPVVTVNPAPTGPTAAWAAGAIMPAVGIAIANAINAGRYRLRLRTAASHRTAAHPNRRPMAFDGEETA